MDHGEVHLIVPHVMYDIWCKIHHLMYLKHITHINVASQQHLIRLYKLSLIPGFPAFHQISSHKYYMINYYTIPISFNIFYQYVKDVFICQSLYISKNKNKILTIVWTNIFTVHNLSTVLPVLSHYYIKIFTTKKCLLID